MNRTIIIIAVGVLLIAGVIIFGVLYAQESGKLDDALDNIATLETDLATAQAEVDDLETDLGAAQAEVAGLQTDLADAQDEVTRLEGELAAAEDDLATAESEIDDLQDDLTDAQDEVASLEADLATAQAEVAGLEADLATAQAEIADLELELDNAWLEVSALSDQLVVVRNPQHFSSVTELEGWLAQDDTDEVYAETDVYSYVYVLQARALRDGYLLPANFEDIDLDYEADSAGNMANINGDLYIVWPFSDEYKVWMFGERVPAHPLPVE